MINTTYVSVPSFVTSLTFAENSENNILDHHHADAQRYLFYDKYNVCDILMTKYWFVPYLLFSTGYIISRIAEYAFYNACTT